MMQRHSKLICEVLSDSTAAFDRGEKFLDYQKLESLEEYVLISQDTQQVECRRRQADGCWETQVYRAGDRVVLASLEFEFEIDELYVDID
jgi:Uma2 family endonuclease